MLGRKVAHHPRTSESDQGPHEDICREMCTREHAGDAATKREHEERVPGPGKKTREHHAPAERHRGVARWDPQIRSILKTREEASEVIKPGLNLAAADGTLTSEDEFEQLREHSSKQRGQKDRETAMPIAIVRDIHDADQNPSPHEPHDSQQTIPIMVFDVLKWLVIEQVQEREIEQREQHERAQNDQSESHTTHTPSVSLEWAQISHKNILFTFLQMVRIYGCESVRGCQS